MPGTIGIKIPARRTRSTITLEEIVVVEELRDGAVGAGIDLSFQRADLGVPVGALRMLFRIGGNGDLGRACELQCLDELRRVAIAERMRLIGHGEAAGRIAAKRHEALDADFPEQPDRMRERVAG